MAMQERISYAKAAPAGYQAMLGVHKYLLDCGLEHSLLDLINLRASQINGCAYSIDMHWKELRAMGEQEQRLYMLTSWRESNLYTPRERAALEWTEAVTLIAAHRAPDDVYAKVRPFFTDHELANLTMAIATINSWNRIGIALRKPPGGCISPAKPRVVASA